MGGTNSVFSLKAPGVGGGRGGVAEDIGGARYADEGAFACCCLRRRKNQNTSPMMAARPTTPPTTPPAMAPTFVLLPPPDADEEPLDSMPEPVAVLCPEDFEVEKVGLADAVDSGAFEYASLMAVWMSNVLFVYG